MTYLIILEEIIYVFIVRIKYVFLKIQKKKTSQREIFLKLIYIKCFLVSTEINQFLLHTDLISHLNSKYVMLIRPLS